MTDREKCLYRLRENLRSAKLRRRKAKRYGTQLRLDGRIAAYETAIELVRVFWESHGSQDPNSA